MQQQYSARDRIFLSYATEDYAVAEWLTFKLTALGYSVWCDRVQLLGGESYPTEIDTAIKEQTFRFIALLSRSSLNKPNPVKERTLALNIARERHTDFLIPLNLVGLGPTELPWELSDLDYIDFRRWDRGLSQLVKALQKAEAPRPIADGSSVVVSSVIPDALLREEPEDIFSNILTIRRVPASVLSVQFKHSPTESELDLGNCQWPHWRVSPRTLLAFESPPDSLVQVFGLASILPSAWRSTQSIEGVPSRNAVKALVSKSLIVLCLRRGLVLGVDRRRLHFPPGFAPGNKLVYTHPDGKKGHLFAVGERGFFRAGRKSERYRYHLSPRFTVHQHLIDDFGITLNIGLHITDLEGRSLSTKSTLARIKRITGDWWNKAWGTGS